MEMATTTSISTSINSSNIMHLPLSNDLTLSTNPYRTVEVTVVTVQVSFIIITNFRR